MIQVGKAINGISLNGDEWLLNTDNSVMEFNTKNDAKTFLKENGYDLTFDELEDIFTFKGENHVVTYGAESSFDSEDLNKEFPEHVVVVADFGVDGTQTVSTISGVENLQAVNDLLDFIANPYENKM